MKILKVVALVFVFLFINGFFFDVYAQCAMCQATVASNLDGGGNAGKTLNNGIMYLLAAPYIAMAAIGYLWYKKYKKKNVVVDMKQH